MQTIPLTKAVRLAPGVTIPLIGFGTWGLNAATTPSGTCKTAVLEALRQGIRHIDTAYSYNNEEEVGDAIKESGVKREELFVTSKLYNTFHKPEDVPVAIEKSLKNLGLEYVDLYLMHFPHAYAPGPNYEVLYHATSSSPSNSTTPSNSSNYPSTPFQRPIIDYELSRDYVSTWKAMEKLVDEGKTWAIGISNFNILKTRKLLKEARIRPVVNQVELHPYFPQKELLEFSKKEGIHLTAHSPLGGAPFSAVALNADKPGPLQDPLILSLSEKYSCLPSQILLSWAVQRGTSVVPKSTKTERIRMNSRLFELSEEDFRLIDTLRDDGKDGGYLRMNDPRLLLGFDGYNEELEEP